MTTSPFDTSAEQIARAVADVLTQLLAPKNCITCNHFDEHQGEVCSKAGQRPPARVIATGCKAWEQIIPF